MDIAPEPILRAGMDTVGWACIFIRNQTIRDGTPIKMINDVMEAVHVVPQMLTHWRPDTLREMRIHFGCFPSSQWPGAPNLLAFFEDRLKNYGCDDSVS
jgi:hypothetical protein